MSIVVSAASRIATRWAKVVLAALWQKRNSGPGGGKPIRTDLRVASKWAGINDWDWPGANGEGRRRGTEVPFVPGSR